MIADESWHSHWSARFGAGADNYGAWLDAGEPRADHGKLLLEFGRHDAPIASAVRRVMDQLPEAVADFVARNVVVRCGDCAENPIDDAIGWCRESSLDDERPLEIGLLVDDPKIVAHEIAHAFQMPPKRSLMFGGLDDAQRARVRQAAREMIVERGESDLAVREQMDRERAADALATLWLGVVVDTTSGDRGEQRIRSMHDLLDGGRIKGKP